MRRALAACLLPKPSRLLIQRHIELVSLGLLCIAPPDATPPPSPLLLLLDHHGHLPIFLLRPSVHRTPPTGASVNVAKFGHHRDPQILYPEPKSEDFVDVHLTCVTLDRQDRFGIRQVPLRPETMDP